MAKTKRKVTKNGFRATALSDFLLLGIGIILLNHSISTIQNNRPPMNRTGSTVEPMGKYDGSPDWWRNAYTTLFLPLTAVFLTIGGIIMFTQPLLTLKHRKSTINNILEYLNQKSESMNNQELTKEQS